MEKKYNIVLGLMIFFFIIVVGVAVAWGLGYIGFNNNVDDDKDNNVVINEQEKTDNDKEEKQEDKIEADKNNDIGKLSVEEKKNLLTVRYDFNENKGKCQQGDCDLYFKAHLPKLNLNTETANNINFKIKDLYIQANEYYKQDFSTKTGSDGKYISYDIKSKYGYVESVDCIYIAIENAKIHSHATGTVENITFIYKVDADKQISLKELLDSRNVSRTDVENKFKSSEAYKLVESNGVDVGSILNNALDNDYAKVAVKNITENSITLSIVFSVTDEAIVTFNL